MICRSVRAPKVDMFYGLMLAHFAIGHLDAEIGVGARANHLRRVSRIASKPGAAYARTGLRAAGEEVLS